MAKLKIRKLLKDFNTVRKQLDDATIILALAAHKNGGELSFTLEELRSMPPAEFGIFKADDYIKIVLNYVSAMETIPDSEVETSKEVETP